MTTLSTRDQIFILADVLGRVIMNSHTTDPGIEIVDLLNILAKIKDSE